MKDVVATMIKKYFPRLKLSQRVLFEASPFAIFLGMHIPHGDPLLVHMMMLHEIRCQQVFEMGGFFLIYKGRSWILVKLNIFSFVV